ncbi:MAG: aldo/keto reductase [Acidobacteria bacterium]|nr:aldo/keto reductase [Acidobacteriota bacterium]
MSSFERTVLGRTGLEVGRLGVASTYGVPAAALERAFEEGVNYFYWGTYRRSGFAEGLRRLASQRERFVLVVQSYSRMASLIGPSLERALRRLRFDHADVLLLGLWGRRPPPRVLEACRRLQQRGLVRWLALSTHRRRLVPQLAAETDFDIFHVRYNAVHTGAERDIFPHLPAEKRPGIVAFTATSWRQLLGSRKIPRQERIPTAGDCYRFVLSNSAVSVCMSGPASAAQMEQALEALHRGPMTDGEIAWMRRVGDAIYGKPRGH